MLDPAEGLNEFVRQLWEKRNAGNRPPRWTDRRWDGEGARKALKMNHDV